MMFSLKPFNHSIRPHKAVFANTQENPETSQNAQRFSKDRKIPK
jgi:hypothetical protein